jgi:cobalamin biosynthesis protein CbiD
VVETAAAAAAAALEGTVYGEYRYAVNVGSPELSMSNSP